MLTCLSVKLLCLVGVGFFGLFVVGFIFFLLYFHFPAGEKNKTNLRECLPYSIVVLNYFC